MNEALLYGLGGALVVAVLFGAASIRIVPEYERGVIFRLGRVIGAKGPGLFFIIPIVDRMVKVFPIPVELLRFFDSRSDGTAR